MKNEHSGPLPPMLFLLHRTATIDPCRKKNVKKGGGGAPLNFLHEIARRWNTGNEEVVNCKISDIEKFHFF